MEFYGLNLFNGLGKSKKEKGEEKNLEKLSPVPPHEEGGLDRVISAGGGHYGYYYDIDGSSSSEKDLILKYREISQYSECDAAIEDIVNEAIVSDNDSSPVQIILDDLDQPDRIKKLIYTEFDKIIELLNFNWKSHELFRKWYVDGRLYYHKIIDPSDTKKGILELRLVDPTSIKKIREVEEETDQKTGIKFVKSMSEYFVYSPQNIISSNKGIKIPKDSICFVTSGVTDVTQKKVLSYLHKAIKPINQLRMLEDSLVIYRLSRAPERRVFYIDVGNLPKGVAEEYMRSIISKYRNKIVYDAKTGEVVDNKQHMSMLEDFWLPRREGGKGTEVTTLSGGDNLSSIDDIVYFQRKMYKSLNVPISRLESDTQFSIGRATEITRDEIKFQKFIGKIRKQFSILFIDLLKTQLILKEIITESEWDVISQKITIDYIHDNHFTELKNIEILSDRIRVAQDLEPYLGKYFSKKWVRKNVLMQTDEQIEKIDEEIGVEKKESPPESDDFGI
jgi:hypothetical protein